MESWEEIQGFRSPGEYQRFLASVKGALKEGALQEIPVGSKYVDSAMLDEHWYRSDSGEIWRLVAPDYPFTGVFERVHKYS